jgi:hypothetical protein
MNVKSIVSLGAAAAALICLGPFCPSALGSPKTWVKISGSHASVGGDHWDLQTESDTHECILKGNPTTEPSLVSVPGHDGRAIRIELDPTSGEGPDHGRDKINYKVVDGHDSHAPTFDGRTTYYAFSLRLDPDDFQTPTTGRNYILAQWWQGVPFGPPLSLVLVPADSPTDEPKFAFEIRNQDTGANPGARPVAVHSRHYKTLDRGKWYRFVVATKFDYSGDGDLHVWINSDSDEEISWHGKLGYDPSDQASDLGFKTGHTDQHPDSHLELYFGPYRDRMDSKQVYYYDDISYGPERPSAEL